MTARWYHADVNGTFVEITDRVARVGWEIREQAEEGSGATSTVVFDDPDMDWAPEPWRNWYVLEDTSEDANSMLCGGWVTEQEIGRDGGEWTQPLARVWSVGHTDANTYWLMRVMVGADANRPAETDVERMQWLLATNEMAWAGDTSTYVQTTSPISMDACDYRGQMLNQIVDDCAQASGRNWYAWIDYLYDVRTVSVWYGHDDWAVRDSPLSLSNDPDDWTDAALDDGTSLVWPISMDTKLNRDPSRMYDGVYLQYEGGAVYRDTDPRTVRRDFISPSLNVKSQAKAVARATRYLAELDEQNLVITTTVELPAAKATMIRAGMAIPFRATHLPGFDTPAVFTRCRVLSCSVSPVAAGERYRLTLELVPVETPIPTVKWIFYTEQGDGFTAGITIEASDDGSNWTEITNAAALQAGTVNPPNVLPGTYEGLVEVSAADWSHRYWRLAYNWDHPGGYFAGVFINFVRLLSGSDYNAVCRLGTPSQGFPTAWWEAQVATWPATDIPFAGAAGPGPMCYSAFDASYPGETSLTDRQSSGGYGVVPGVFGPTTFTATFTFDLLEGA